MLGKIDLSPFNTVDRVEDNSWSIWYIFLNIDLFGWGYLRQRVTVDAPWDFVADSIGSAYSGQQKSCQKSKEACSKLMG